KCALPRDALPNGLEHVIVTQDGSARPTRSSTMARITSPTESREVVAPILRTVLVWRYEDSLYSLRCRTSTQRHGIWRAHESAVQVFEMRENNNRRD